MRNQVNYQMSTLTENAVVSIAKVAPTLTENGLVFAKIAHTYLQSLTWEINKQVCQLDWCSGKVVRYESEQQWTKVENKYRTGTSFGAIYINDTADIASFDTGLKICYERGRQHKKEQLKPINQDRGIYQSSTKIYVRNSASVRRIISARAVVAIVCQY